MKKLIPTRIVQTQPEVHAMQAYLDRYWENVPRLDTWVADVQAKAQEYSKYVYNVPTWITIVEREKRRRKAYVEKTFPTVIDQAIALDDLSNLMNNMSLAGLTIVDVLRKKNSASYLFDDRVDEVVQLVKALGLDWSKARPREDQAVDMENEMPAFDGHFFPSPGAFSFAEGMSHEYARKEKGSEPYLRTVVTNVYNHLTAAVEHTNAVRMGYELATLVQKHRHHTITLRTRNTSLMALFHMCFDIACQDALSQIPGNNLASVKKRLRDVMTNRRWTTKAQLQKAFKDLCDLQERTPKMTDTAIQEYINKYFEENKIFEVYGSLYIEH